MNSNYTGPQTIEGYLQKKKRRVKGGMKTNWRYLKFSLNEKERTLVMKNKKEDPNFLKIFPAKQIKSYYDKLNTNDNVLDSQTGFKISTTKKDYVFFVSKSEEYIKWKRILYFFFNKADMINPFSKISLDEGENNKNEISVNKGNENVITGSKEQSFIKQDISLREKTPEKITERKKNFIEKDKDKTSPQRSKSINMNDLVIKEKTTEIKIKEKSNVSPNTSSIPTATPQGYKYDDKKNFYEQRLNKMTQIQSKYTYVDKSEINNIRGHSPNDINNKLAPVHSKTINYVNPAFTNNAYMGNNHNKNDFMLADMIQEQKNKLSNTIGIMPSHSPSNDQNTNWNNYGNNNGNNNVNTNLNSNNKPYPYDQNNLKEELSFNLSPVISRINTRLVYKDKEINPTNLNEVEDDYENNNFTRKETFIHEEKKLIKKESIIVKVVNVVNEKNQKIEVSNNNNNYNNYNDSPNINKTNSIFFDDTKSFGLDENYGISKEKDNHALSNINKAKK
jgi:hypothetical protein